MNYEPLVVFEDTTNLDQKIQNIEANTPLELADGIQMTLWASDSLAPDPIAMSMDNSGNVYLTRTNRQKNSEFDIRGHQDWMTASIGLQSVEDRRSFLRSVFHMEKSDENSWLKDLNGDSINDWQDLAVEEDEIWRLEDTDGDGVADVSTRILSDFADEVSDVAGALLVRDNDVFVGIGPDMWRVYDKDKNGILDEKESIAHGFNVHIGFGGHGMSGAVEGPDGKIYYGIGDVGANITSVDGKKYKYPNQGVLVRSNPDGSNFEVFAAGLRNTHEFAFDAYGNIIGADNDGDHEGESERLVHIVEGSDQGWRINWQFGKYTDPKNNSYKVWMEEKLYVPRWEGQAAYIMPPITNYHNGPTGFVYNPGTALGSKWTNKFFVVEFVGTPSRSPIWAFSLKPKGASFELDEDIMVAKGILPTGIRFGPDGALYAADWINGWGTKNYGRVWKLDVTTEENDLAEQREDTERLMTIRYDQQELTELYDLLMYPDMRIRQKAQFELTDRKGDGKNTLIAAIEQKDNQFARFHGIWGVGMMIEKELADGNVLMPFLEDSDPEIIAQVLKVLGDLKYDEGADSYLPLVNHENPRVKFYASQALGRIGERKAIPGLLAMLEDNDDNDLHLRHAAVLALSRIGAEAEMLDFVDHDQVAMRTAAVLVLRRMGSPSIAEFLNDPDEYVVTEAARAINDDYNIDDALPALAGILADERYTGEPLLRRAINAAFEIGGSEQISLMVDFLDREDVDSELTAEVLMALGTYEQPSPHDRVDGRYRVIESRDPTEVVNALTPKIESLLENQSDEIIKATGYMIGSLGITDFNDQLVQMASAHKTAEVRSAMVDALYQLNYDGISKVIQTAMNDDDEDVRSTGIKYLAEMNLSGNELPSYVLPVFEKGSISEQQQMFATLGGMDSSSVEELFSSLIDKWIAQELDPGISLDLVEAIDNTQSDVLLAKIEPHRLTGNTTEDYMDVLYGGNGRAGWGNFHYNSTAQCIRCHSWENEAGSVGPSLTGIASRLTREQLLEALIEPSARIAPGFGSVVLSLKDGSTVTGILLEEASDHLLLKTNEAEPLEIQTARIENRQNLPSSMPQMGLILSKREIRDLVAFLSGLED